MVDSNATQAHIVSKWFPISLVPLLVAVILGLSYRFVSRRRVREQNLTKKGLSLSNTDDSKRSKRILSMATTVNAAGESACKREHLSTSKSTSESRPTSASTLTNTDIAHLDRIIRTASDRSLWKLDDPAKKPRRVPSGLLHPQPSSL
jgi:hypothetical protein